MDGAQLKTECAGWCRGVIVARVEAVQLECAEKLEIGKVERDRFLIVSSVEQASANINHD